MYLQQLVVSHFGSSDHIDILLVFVFKVVVVNTCNHNLALEKIPLENTAQKRRLLGDFSFRNFRTLCDFYCWDFNLLTVCQMTYYHGLFWFSFKKKGFIFCLLLVNIMLNLNGTCKVQYNKYLLGHLCKTFIEGVEKFWCTFYL